MTLAAMTVPEVVALVATMIAGLLGGGFGVALLHRKKTAAEVDGIKITGQLELADRALDFNRELLQRVETLEKALREDEEREDRLEARIAKLESEVRTLEAENQTLKGRVRELEAENDELRKNGT